MGRGTILLYLNIFFLALNVRGQCFFPRVAQTIEDKNLMYTENIARGTGKSLGSFKFFYVTSNVRGQWFVLDSSQTVSRKNVIFSEKCCSWYEEWFEIFLFFLFVIIRQGVVVFLPQPSNYDRYKSTIFMKHSSWAKKLF